MGLCLGLFHQVLLGVLWSYHTTTQSTTREMPLGLVYGSDVVLPKEVEITSRRVEDFNEKELTER